jgi:peptidoglycan biosynthesis protein MviN/MurJ (putative lipid II flippase)
MAATIPLTIALTIPLGATGAALGVTLGACVQLAVQFGVLRAHLSQPMLKLWPARQLAGLVAAYAGGFAVARLVDSLLPGLLGLLAALTVGAAAYAVFLLVVGGLLPRDRARVEAIATAVAPRSKWVARIIPRPQPST